jgi:phosphoglycerate dehydrogenase-like enzyme
MQVVLTAVAYESFGAQISRSGVDWLVMNEDGTLSDPHGAPQERADAHPEIAWGTSDLFREGAPLVPFFAFMLESAGLAWFQSPAAGYDNPEFRMFVDKGVRVTNAHVTSLPIAEFVMRSVLDEFQEAAQWRDLALERRWKIHDWREVSGSTWVIVGLGGIGTEVARRAQAFGVHLIGLADVIVLAAPATPETDNLVDADFLLRAKPGSLLVNVARGTLVDDNALIASLDSGHLSVAILDVFRTEPLPVDHPFWSHPSIRVTPHNAAGGVGRFQRQADLFGENLDRYLGGRPLLNDVTDAIAGAARSTPADE